MHRHLIESRGWAFIFSENFQGHMTVEGQTKSRNHKIHHNSPTVSSCSLSWWFWYHMKSTVTCLNLYCKSYSYVDMWSLRNFSIKNKEVNNAWNLNLYSLSRYILNAAGWGGICIDASRSPNVEIIVAELSGWCSVEGSCLQRCWTRAHWCRWFWWR